MRSAPESWRTVEVPADRLDGWLGRFEARHGAVRDSRDDEAVTLTAADGAVARVHLPCAPSPGDSDDLVAAAAAFGSFGLVLVRRGGFAVGRVEQGSLKASRCGTRYVQGKTKAGGWSQQRFARRRANQADAVAQAAAGAVSAVLGRIATTLVCGGDRTLVRQTLELSGADGWPVVRWLDVPDPRRQVLIDAIPRARAARIDLNSAARSLGS